MNKQSRILHMHAYILALTLLLSGCSTALTPTPLPTTAPTALAPPATAATTASAAAGSSKAACLMCHGPFDKLISATADYKMTSGEEEIKSSPHRYVPHNSKNITECSECHKPHPVPLTSTEGLPKPNANWCYLCHHEGVLQCGTCHK
jgi:predicted CXXCH cytochrome family protein